MSNVVVEINDLEKKFKKYTIQINSLKSFVLNYKTYKSEKEKISELAIINGLSLKIYKSDILCIVGLNGAGKSTLAKLIAGTTKPTSGSVNVKGRIVPFLELGVAFNTELSGRDNVYLNGVLLGLSTKYIRENMNKIFEYAELNDFIDTPLKYYSSGMQMRLAFSVGMHADGDIYIFDEILSVGDANFKKKCITTFHNLIDKGRTIIIVTHDLSVVREYANKVLLLNRGKYKLLTDVNDIRKIDDAMLNEIDKCMM